MSGFRRAAGGMGLECPSLLASRPMPLECPLRAGCPDTAVAVTDARIDPGRAEVFRPRWMTPVESGLAAPVSTTG